MSRHARGRGTARRRKERELRLSSGFTKPMLDAMNRESRQRFGLGVGVLVQEQARAADLVRSIETQAAGMRLGRLRLRKVLASARHDHEFWSGRLREVSEAVAVEREDLDRATAAR